MSNLAIAAAHLITIPTRYAVGRWNDIPINTLLVFNATDLGLNIVIKGIYDKIIERWEMNVPAHLEKVILYVSRVVVCLIAIYVTSRLTEPIPLKAAALINLACLVSVFIACSIASRGKQE
jgi:hypothetical protein